MAKLKCVVRVNESFTCAVGPVLINIIYQIRIELSLARNLNFLYE